MGRKRNLRGGSTTAYYYDASDDETIDSFEEVADTSADDEDEDEDEDGIEWRPTSPHGATIDFFCCEDADVRWVKKNKWDSELAICQNCDCNWTEYIDDE